MKSPDIQKVTGRPLKNPERGKRSNVMFRLGEVQKAQVMQAAEAAGRSMSEEIEWRIMRSFDEPNLIDRIADAVVERMKR